MGGLLDFRLPDFVQSKFILPSFIVQSVLTSLELIWLIPFSNVVR